jgi:hypothetical protein
MSVFFSGTALNTNISTSGKKKRNYLLLTDMMLFNSYNFWKYNIKYLQLQSVILEKVPYVVSHGQWYKFLTNLCTTWCIFSEEFQLCKLSIWNKTLCPLKCCMYRCPSLLDLCKQISCMYTSCTDPGSYIQINIISSCYLQWTPLKHHHLCYLITPHDTDCKIMFPIHV